MADKMEVERALRVLGAHLTYVSDDKDWQEAEDALATLRAELDGLRRDAAIGREIAAAFLPVMEAARPLVLNFERLRDAMQESSYESR